MAMFNAKNDRAGNPEAVTLVGEEAYFHGVLAVKGSLRVDGIVEGDITDAVSVEIGKKGKVKGNIAAEAVSVAGSVEGDVIASRSIEIMSGGRVVGSIRTPTLRIEDGAMFDGQCAMASAQEGDAPATSSRESYQSVEQP
jgi:cytoskeletal protein CcmA (bactofilin family)